MRRLLSGLLMVLIAEAAGASVMINLVRPWRDGTGVGPEASSMVQLYNDGAADVSLSGWHLKGNGWSYPFLFWTIPAGAYLYVVFDSGTNDADFSDGVGVLYTGTIVSFNRGADEVGLYNAFPSQASIVDFVGWGEGGSTFGTPYTHATGAGIWPTNAFVDLTSMGLFSSIGRIPSGFDNDLVDDWQELGKLGCDHFSPHNSIQIDPIDGVFRDDITTLSWRPVPGATQYLVEVDDDPNFGSPNISQLVTGTSFAFNLGDGVWYWRVTPQLATARPAAVWRFTRGTPDINETNTVTVPQRYQHKDSPLLCIYSVEWNNNERGGCEETGGTKGPWDYEHAQGSHIEGCPHCANYCARASIQMVNTKYGGSLKQDEISYHGWWNRIWGDKPEDDLGHGEGMWPQSNNTYSWAMNGASIDSVSNVGGADSSISLGAVANEIDAGRPVLAIRAWPGGGLHAIVINGYTTAFGNHMLYITDPWPGNTGWQEWDRVLITCYYKLQGTPTGRATDSNVESDADGDGVKDFDEGQQTTEQTPRTFHSLYNDDDTEDDEVKDLPEIRAYTFHDEDHGGHDNDDIMFSDIDQDGDRSERDCDSENDRDFDGGEDINGDGKNPIGGLETCEFDGHREIDVYVLLAWGGWLCTEDVWAGGQTYHNYSTYPAELIIHCPGHDDGDPLFNNLSLFAAEDGIIHPQFIGSFGPGIYQLTVDVLKDALYSEPDNWDPLTCFAIPPHIMIVPPPTPTPVPPPPAPTPVPTGDYGWALEQLGKQYVVYDYPWGGPGPSLDTLLSYPVVIWCTGALQGTMSAQDATNLMQYIDLGGKVFFTGAEIAKDAMTSGDVPKVQLLNQYMGAMYAGENPGCTRIYGWPDSFFDVYTDVQIDRYNDIYWDYQSPDAVLPAALTQPLLGYSESADCMPGALAGFATEGPNGLDGRCVYMSFPWESIVEEEVRVEMLDIILQWLYGESMPPPAVEDLTVMRTEEGIQLDWEPEPGIVSYNIYASDRPDFEPSEENQISVVSIPPFVDPEGMDLEKRFYCVVSTGPTMEGELGEWMRQQSDLDTILERLDAERIHYRVIRSDE